MDRYKTALRQHLSFINSSCIQYDKGNYTEALRIAVSLRVIFHDTKSSTSLIKYLNSKAIELITESPIWSDDTPVPILHMPFLYDSDNGYKPMLGRGVGMRVLNVNDWWEQYIFAHDRQWVKRKQIILWAANKDGGAHVDDKLPKAYSDLMSSFDIISTDRTTGEEISRESAREPYMLIRQSAFEVLHSQSIRNLVK